MRLVRRPLTPFGVGLQEQVAGPQLGRYRVGRQLPGGHEATCQGGVFEEHPLREGHAAPADQQPDPTRASL